MCTVNAVSVIGRVTTRKALVLVLIRRINQAEFLIKLTLSLTRKIFKEITNQVSVMNQVREDDAAIFML